jgi:hypothetical protein
MNSGTSGSAFGATSGGGLGSSDMGVGGTPSQGGSQAFGQDAGFGGGTDAMPSDRQGGAAGVAHHLADKASDIAGQGRAAAADKLGTVKDRAADLKSTLADKLQQGAEALRRNAQTAGQPGGPEFAGATSSGGAAGLLGNPKAPGYSNQLAGGMQGAADFLRDGDLQGSLEKQVRENPARTLLIALGLGYVIGKAVRK